MIPLRSSYEIAPHNRRHFIRRIAPVLMVPLELTGQSCLADNAAPQLEDLQLGVLVGGLIGDALGGPIEFTTASAADCGLAGARDWDPEQKLSDQRLSKLAASVPVLGYETLRPEAAPYGPWRERAPAGTLTDDSRHKMVLLRAIRTAIAARRQVDPQDIARAFLDFQPVQGESDRSLLEAMNSEGFQEYRYAARWLLGERQLSRARPLERLWGGISNCSGQMMFPPLSVAFAGLPTEAYLKTFELDFIDAPQARDMAASINAGLAAALSPNLVEASVDLRWQAFLKALHDTDPYGLSDIPFAGRPLTRWLEKADELVERCQGSPQRLYRLLETEGQPKYWWDAHFTLLVPLCMLQLCRLDPLAALHLTLDFGHDTDSYAQLLGCIVGALYGKQVFPEAMQTPVIDALARDYGEDINVWLSNLQEIGGHPTLDE